MIHFEAIPHEEAARIIAEKPLVDRALFEKLLPELRARTFLISGIEDMNVVQQIRDIIAELPRGQDWEQSKKQIEKKLGPWMDAEAAHRRAELLLRHHGFQAYAAADYRGKVAHADTFPFWQYRTLHDERVRDSHAALHGLILPWNDPFWETHYPPWDWGCRCTVVGISAFEVAELQAKGRVAGPNNLTEREKNNGWLLPEKGVELLHDGRLETGDGTPVDIRPPAARAHHGTVPYAWQPGEMTLSLADLRRRYDPDVFASFLQQAEREKLPDGRTVLSWLSGEPEPVGGVRPPTIPKETTLENSLAKWEKDIVGLDHEVFVPLNADGTLIAKPFHSDTYGGFVPSQWNLRGATFLHNHPSGVLKPEQRGFSASFSLEDILMAANNAVAGIIATNRRRTYIMKPIGQWPEPLRIHAAYQRELFRVKGYIKPRIANGRMSDATANVLHQDVIWKRVAKELGMEYRVIRKRQ